MTVGAGSTSTIKNLRFEGAREVNGSGGGINNWGTLTVQDCTITDCQAVNGGGIANYKTLTVNSSSISASKAPNSDGGGIYCAPVINCTTTLSGTTLANNKASK